MDQLSDQILADLLKRLLLLEKELNQQLKINREAAGVVELDQTSVGRVSRMEAIQQQSMVISTREKTSLRLEKVRYAIKMMAQDEYGFCKRCDEVISFARLLAQPESNLCVNCQTRVDTQR